MKHLSEYTREKQSVLFNETGAFFAFGQQQFNEKAKKDVKYCHVGAGLICPTENVKQLTERLDKIQDEAIKQDVEDNGAKAIIEREYFNHECQITMDNSDALAAIHGHIERFPELFTEELIDKTCKECFQKAIDNDWF